MATNDPFSSDNIFSQFTDTVNTVSAKKETTPQPAPQPETQSEENTETPTSETSKEDKKPATKKTRKAAPKKRTAAKKTTTSAAADNLADRLDEATATIKEATTALLGGSDLLKTVAPDKALDLLAKLHEATTMTAEHRDRRDKLVAAYDQLNELL